MKKVILLFTNFLTILTKLSNSVEYSRNMKEKYSKIHSDTYLQVLIDWLIIEKYYFSAIWPLISCLIRTNQYLSFLISFFISENYYYTNIVSLIRHELLIHGLVVLLFINPINSILPTWVTTSFYRVLPICQNILPFGSDYHIKNGKHFPNMSSTH